MCAACSHRSLDHFLHLPIRRVITLEICGFVLLAILSWCDELFRVSDVIFGGQTAGDWHEAVLETLIIFCVAVPLIIFQYRLLISFKSHASFLHICAWCKRIELEGEWLELEHFFNRRSQAKLTHGICGDCARSILDKDVVGRN